MFLLFNVYIIIIIIIFIRNLLEINRLIKLFETIILSVFILFFF